MNRRIRNSWKQILGCAIFLYVIFVSDSIFKEKNEKAPQNQQVVADVPKPVVEANLDSLDRFKPKLTTQNMVGCSRLPEDSEIKYSNVVWQVVDFSKGPVYLFNAYLDTRGYEKVVRINANSNYSLNEEEIFCQLWYDGEAAPKVTKAVQNFYMWNTEFLPLPKTTLPYLINCPVPDRHPSSVSLATKMCDIATNNLKIIGRSDIGPKQTFTVCSKIVTLDTPEQIFRFIEWVHLLKMLGAEKIFFYYKNLKDFGMKTVKHFMRKEFVDMWHFSEPAGVNPSDASISQNLLNDCFHKVRNSFEVIFMFEPDEVVIPVYQSDLKWMDIISKINKDDVHDAYYSKSVFYPTSGVRTALSIPKHHHILQHTQRIAENTDAIGTVRSFIVPDRTIVVHDHMAAECMFEKCRVSQIAPEIAQTNIYRDLPNRGTVSYVEDQVVWKFKDELLKEVEATVSALNLTSFL